MVSWLKVALPATLLAMGCIPTSPNGAAPVATIDMAAVASSPAADLAVAALDGATSTTAAHFDPDIQHDLDSLGCTTSACHGGATSPVILPMPATSAAWLSNYDDIHKDCTTLDCLGGGANSLLLTKPLQGSVVHGGIKPFSSTSDPIYQRWLAWIAAGAPYSATQPVLTADMAMAPAGKADMGATESLTLTFTTTASPSAGASKYDPKNVVAVWIESPAGAFVKTIGRWANVRRTHLVSWVAKAGNADVDAISSATNAAYGTLTAKWDMTARQTPAPPLPPPADGIYTIHLELADSDSSQAAQNNEGSFTFNRNGVASTQTNQTNGGFTKVDIVYSGR
jgi:hypothetical protein